ncbi:hypothetical protein LCGC14_1770750 [marine sediment metagenome]|uniref:Uncharacterized protein n=1 Tax=marine sediment metagenome TaxID=412755 RepID=A0A0F9GYD1_9ZZZZ
MNEAENKGKDAKDLKKVIALNSLQIESLQRLSTNARQVELMLNAAEQSTRSYIRCIADSHEVDSYSRVELDSEKKTLTLTLKRDDNDSRV